jgi:hypothetical protein
VDDDTREDEDAVDSRPQEEQRPDERESVGPRPSIGEVDDGAALWTPTGLVAIASLALAIAFLPIVMVGLLSFVLAPVGLVALTKFAAFDGEGSLDAGAAALLLGGVGGLLWSSFELRVHILVALGERTTEPGTDLVTAAALVLAGVLAASVGLLRRRDDLGLDRALEVGCYWLSIPVTTMLVSATLCAGAGTSV